MGLYCRLAPFSTATIEPKTYTMQAAMSAVDIWACTNVANTGTCFLHFDIHQERSPIFLMPRNRSRKKFLHCIAMQPFSNKGRQTGKSEANVRKNPGLPYPHRDILSRTYITTLLQENKAETTNMRSDNMPSFPLKNHHFMASKIGGKNRPGS